MRRIEDIYQCFTIHEWLDEDGEVTMDKEAVQDIVLKLDTGELCVISLDTFSELDEDGFIELESRN